MWEITEIFEDISRPNGKGYLNLNPDRATDSYHVKYPITWTGLISGHEIEIIQKGSSALLENDFQWTKFPLQYDYVKGDIVKWINDSLND